MIRRPVHLRRSWLFLPGADPAGLQAGAECTADVVEQELEDFTPPARRPEARELAPSLYPAWRAAGRYAGDGATTRADWKSELEGRGVAGRVQLGCRGRVKTR